MTLLEQVKLLLGITGTEKDALLSLLCDTVTEQVKTYCRLSDVSGAGLQGLMADMVVNRYRSRGYGKTDSPRTVTAVTEGDTKLEFSVANYADAGALTAEERTALSQYKMVWKW